MNEKLKDIMEGLLQYNRKILEDSNFIDEVLTTFLGRESSGLDSLIREKKSHDKKTFEVVREAEKIRTGNIKGNRDSKNNKSPRTKQDVV